MTDATTAALDLDSKTETILEENEKFWKGPNESGYYNVYGDQFNKAAEILITKYKIPVLKKLGWKFVYNGYTYGCNKYKIPPEKVVNKKWEKTLYKVKRQFFAAKKETTTTTQSPGVLVVRDVPTTIGNEFLIKNDAKRQEEIKKEKEKTSQQIEQELVDYLMYTLAKHTGKIDMYGFIRVIMAVLGQILPTRAGVSN